MKRDAARLRLPRLIGDGMVLQSGKRIRLRGWCAEGDSVVITFTDPSGNRIMQEGTKADESGRWEVFLDISFVGIGYGLTVETGSGEKRRIEDVAAGEVWLCSGQSNMELPMRRVKDRFQSEMGNCADDGLRIFKVSECYAFRGPLEDHRSGEWKKSSKDTILDFSALAYFLGTFLRRDRRVPVGLIDVSLGGSPIEAWMEKDAFLEDERIMDVIGLYSQDSFVEEKLRSDAEASEKWYRGIADADAGLKESWFLEHEGRPGADTEEKEWKRIVLPGALRDRGLTGFIGVIWLRKRIMVPDAMAQKRARLWLGTLVDSDEAYVNGVCVGSTGYQYPPRKYEIPEGLLRAGENTIMIRLICGDGNGRVTPQKPFRIFTEQDCVELSGTWEYRIGAVMQEKAPAADFVSWKPTGLYNGMLAPCHAYTIRGVVWYQGESNDKDPCNYRRRLESLITGWRKAWGLGNIPFLIAQLPNFEIDLPKESGWPWIREAQRLAGELPGTGVTVNIDLGEWNDLHPLNKRDVAYRLSLAARALAYGEAVIWQGPVVSECRKEKEGIILTFENAKGGLITMDQKRPGEFEACGADGRYYPLDARIEGEAVLLKGERIQDVCRIRYAWRNNPDRGLLYNRAGLPAAPFCMAAEGQEPGEG